ncbi:hypothetical protein M422DRAFT_275247 [Sphaerobolus stellatus SS14]|uniref:Uncharacterized protein n=1 Tax=Sphaerobolus stellatus (strain SS14) TaxID=990650 RepID=A0A0C9U4M4_SPHS4|nr:hypothetical protein M422DRAFT_275247 [Sphaerobolus stellatus SS14]
MPTLLATCCARTSREHLGTRLHQLVPFNSQRLNKSNRRALNLLITGTTRLDSTTARYSWHPSITIKFNIEVNLTSTSSSPDSDYTIFIWRQQQPHPQSSQPSTSSSPISPSPCLRPASPPISPVLTLTRTPSPPSTSKPPPRPHPTRLPKPHLLPLPPLPRPALHALPPCPLNAPRPLYPLRQIRQIQSLHSPFNSVTQKGLREIPGVEWC